MGPRKARVRADIGKKLVTKIERILVKEAIEQAALSKRGKVWASLRGDIARVLANKQPGQVITSNETVAIECKIDGRDLEMKEVLSIENSINKWLTEEVKSPFRIRYIETIKKVVLLPEAQITALFGGRGNRE